MPINTKIIITTMKKIIFASFFMLSTLISFSQENTDLQLRNELGISLLTPGVQSINGDKPNWTFSTEASMSLFYRHFLNEKSAIRVDIRQLTLTKDVFNLGVSVGYERYLALTSKLSLYGGAQAYGSYYKSSEYQTYGVGLEAIGGLRYQVNKRISIGTEIVGSSQYHWDPTLNRSSWDNNLHWNVFKIGVNF